MRRYPTAPPATRSSPRSSSEFRSRRSRSTNTSPRAPELLLQRLEWTVIRRLDGLLQGDYRPLFRGQGLDLLDVRAYEPGGDVRYIDSHVTARMAVI